MNTPRKPTPAMIAAGQAAIERSVDRRIPDAVMAAAWQAMRAAEETKP